MLTRKVENGNKIFCKLLLGCAVPNASVCLVANRGQLQIWRGVHVCGGGLGDVPRLVEFLY